MTMTTGKYGAVTAIDVGEIGRTCNKIKCPQQGMSVK